MTTDDDRDDERVEETAPACGSRYITVEEYLELEAASPFRHEYVDGVMYAMSGALVHHCEVTVHRRRDGWRPVVLSTDALTVELESVALEIPMAQIYESVSFDP
jgi:Uma2 family endonuclease